MNRSTESKGAADTSPDPSTLPPVERRLLDAAVKLFSRFGYNAVGVRRVAQEAGVTIGALYHYAGSKEHLLFRIIYDSQAFGVVRARATVARWPDPVAQLQTLVENHVWTQIVDANRQTLAEVELVNLLPESRTKVVAVRDEYERIFHDVLARGEDQDLFQFDDLKVTRMTILAMCTSVSFWFRSDGRFSATEISELYGRLVIKMVKVGSTTELDVRRAGLTPSTAQ